MFDFICAVHIRLICVQLKRYIYNTFWSDGPSTQYKQKNNFARLCTEPFQYGFQSVSSNYFDSAHGKGAADGVMVDIKRLADFAARQGKDVNTPHRLFEVVSAAAQSVKGFFVTEEDFEQSVKQTPSAVAVVKGTQQIHQVTSIQPGRISHRKLSCVLQTAYTWSSTLFVLQS